MYLLRLALQNKHFSRNQWLTRIVNWLLVNRYLRQVVNHYWGSKVNCFPWSLECIFFIGIIPRQMFLSTVRNVYQVGTPIYRCTPCSDRKEKYIFTARKRSLGQGDIFTPVCHSVHGGGVAWFWGGTAPGGGLVLGGCLVEDPPGTATAAGGTHPTGMQSCWIYEDAPSSQKISFLWSS